MTDTARPSNLVTLEIELVSFAGATLDRTYMTIPKSYIVGVYGTDRKLIVMLKGGRNETVHIKHLAELMAILEYNYD